MPNESQIALVTERWIPDLNHSESLKDVLD